MHRWRSIGVLAVAGAVAVTLFIAPVASATTTTVYGEVVVARDGATPAGDYVNSSADCSDNGTSVTCIVNVTLSGRDSKRFARWCGASAEEVVVPAGAVQASSVCDGPGPWAIAVWAYLDGPNATQDVHVEVHVHV